MNGGTARAWKEPTNDNAYKAHMTSEMLISMQNSGDRWLLLVVFLAISVQSAWLHSYANDA